MIERPRSAQRGELDVVGAVPQAGGVLADAAPLERVRDHHHRRRHLDPVVEGREQKGLRAPSRFARAADPRRVDVGQRAEPVERADAVPRLEVGRLKPQRRRRSFKNACVNGLLSL